MLNRFLIAGLIAAAPTASIAHHGGGLYDTKKAVTIAAPLTDVSWGYPHVTANVVWQGKTWKIAFSPAAVLAGRGVTKDLLSSAKAVTVTGQPRRDGTLEFRGSIQLIDGKKY